MTDLSSLWGFLKIVLVILALFNGYVSARVLFQAGASVFQRFTQLLFIWLLPIVGGILVHSLIVVPQWKERNHGFTRDEGNTPPGIKNIVDL